MSSAGCTTSSRGDAGQLRRRHGLGTQPGPHMGGVPKPQHTGCIYGDTSQHPGCMYILASTRAGHTCPTSRWGAYTSMHIDWTTSYTPANSTHGLNPTDRYCIFPMFQLLSPIPPFILLNSSRMASKLVFGFPLNRLHPGHMITCDINFFSGQQAWKGTLIVKYHGPEWG